METRELIQDFLNQKRLAVIGVSRNPNEFSHKLFIEFLKHGYEAIPVNPKSTQIEGYRCYGIVYDIPPPIDSAILLTHPDMTGWVVRTCAHAGVRRIWMHCGRETGAVNIDAVEFCRSKGIQVIVGYCPWMFLSHPGLKHRAHGLMMKLNGQYPV